MNCDMNCYACGHPVAYYASIHSNFEHATLFHIRKGCEYSTTCWQCNCHKAVLSDEDEKLIR